MLTLLDFRPTRSLPASLLLSLAICAVAVSGCTEEPDQPQPCRFLCDSSADSTDDARPEAGKDLGVDAPADAHDAAPDTPADTTADKPPPDSSVDQPPPDTTVDQPTPDSSVDAPRPDTTVDAPLVDSTLDISFDAPPPDGSVDATFDVPVPPDGAPPPLANGVTTLAGWWYRGNQDGTRFAARFDDPANVLCTGSGDIFIADYNNGAIRRSTPAGVVTTLTPTGTFRRPFGMALAPNGKLYVQTDFESTGQAQVGAIWEIDTTTGAATLVLDQSGRARGLVALPDGRLVLLQYDRHYVEILDPASKARTFVAGANGISGYADGTGIAVRFNLPYDGVLDSNGDLIITDTQNNRLRKVTLAGVVTTFAGDGAALTFDGTLTTASFAGPQGLAQDAAGNLYVSESLGYVIRKISTAGQVSTIAGDGVSGMVDATDPLQARFFGLEGIDVVPNGKILYIADGDRGETLPYHRVRRLAFP